MNCQRESFDENQKVQLLNTNKGKRLAHVNSLPRQDKFLIPIFIPVVLHVLLFSKDSFHGKTRELSLFYSKS